MAGIRKFVSLSVGAPVAKTASAPAAAGKVYSITRALGPNSTLSLVTGTDDNLSLSGNSIAAAVAIASGLIQIAIVREVSGQIAAEYPVSLAGTGALTTNSVLSGSSLTSSAVPGFVAAAQNIANQLNALGAQ